MVEENINKSKRVCTKCKLIKEHSIRGRICIDCKKEYDKEYVNLNKEKLKNLGLTYRHKTKQNKKEYDKVYRLKNKDYILANKIERKISGKSYNDARKSMLKKKYKLSLKDYNDLCIQQDNKCLICNTDVFVGKGKKLHVDHCHKTGKIRGLLCQNCNTGLGQFKDNINNLENAIKYLKNHT